MTAKTRRKIRRVKRVAINNKTVYDIQKLVQAFAKEQGTVVSNVKIKIFSAGWRRIGAELVTYTPQTEEEAEKERLERKRERERKVRAAKAEERRRKQWAANAARTELNNVLSREEDLAAKILSVLETDPKVLKKVRDWDKKQQSTAKKGTK